MDRSNPIVETSAVAADASVVQGAAIDVVVEGYDAVYAAIAESATFSRIWQRHVLVTITPWTSPTSASSP
jgi:hypothetical protein